MSEYDLAIRGGTVVTAATPFAPMSVYAAGASSRWPTA